MAYHFPFTTEDRSIMEELREFIPQKIFDFHAHIQGVADRHNETPEFYKNGPGLVSIRDWRQSFGEIFQDPALTGGLFFPGTFPFADTSASNNYLLEELERTPGCKGLILVSPKDAPDSIIKYLKHPQVAGVKPYYMYSTEADTLQSSIKGFFPEWMWEIAGRHKSIVMMHLMRDKGVSDPVNITHIRDMCLRFPSLKLVLAHVARSFHAPNVRGIDQIMDLPNVWFDMSAICESEPIKYLMDKVGSERLMWGSDFPLSHMRTRAVTAGSGFIWLDETCFQQEDHPFARLTLLSLESLRALKYAVEACDLNKKQIQGIFYENAIRLLNMDNLTYQTQVAD